jgi:hypothetical protein
LPFLSSFLVSKNRKQKSRDENAQKENACKEIEERIAMKYGRKLK